MVHYIIADNQELTRFAEECMIRQDERNTLRRATDKAGLVQLLKENEDSVVLLEQIRTLDKRRLKECMGRLEDSTMNKVDQAISISFGLGQDDQDMRRAN